MLLRRPSTLIAELSYRCPLHCPYCSNPTDIGGDRYRSELDTEDWQRVFEQARALGVLQLALTGGEPLVRRDLEQLVETAARTGLYSTLVTAGTLLPRERAERLKEAGLDHVQISIQDPRPEGNDRHRRHRELREEGRGGAARARARLPADHQLRAPPPEPRRDRGRAPARGGARRAAARAREHAVLRVGRREPGGADADARAARARRGGGQADAGAAR